MGNGKVLITGGCGFIGRHLRRKLVAMGRDVAVLDISVPWIGYANGHKMVRGDIRDSELVGRWMEGVEIVYHLAGITEFADCREDPMKALNVNAVATATVLRQAINHKVTNFVYFSSASVYAGSKGPVKREDMELEPQSIYAITKLMGERLCDDIGGDRMICAKLRLLNVYGEGGRGVINKFARAIGMDKHVIIYGDGHQTRDYVHVDDVVKATIEIGERKLPGVYNIGTGEGWELLEIKEIMEEIARVELTVEWKPKEPWDPQELTADTTRIKEILPTTVRLEDGLRGLLARGEQVHPGTRIPSHPASRHPRRSP